jgi:6-pyruvoyltetrahydropterin/6-carboxytetrahydropterin synthase
MFELSKQFRFDSAHTLERKIETEASRRIHGHSYRVEVTVRGVPDKTSGMIVDLGMFECALADTREALDHRLLDEINDLGPATLENLSAWIWRRLSSSVKGLSKVTVYRDSQGEACVYRGPDQAAA